MTRCVAVKGFAAGTVFCIERNRCIVTHAGCALVVHSSDMRLKYSYQLDHLYMFLHLHKNHCFGVPKYTISVSTKSIHNMSGIDVKFYGKFTIS